MKKSLLLCAAAGEGSGEGHAPRITFFFPFAAAAAAAVRYHRPAEEVGINRVSGEDSPKFEVSDELKNEKSVLMIDA